MRADDAWLGKTYTYTYDAGGNITSENVYAYTTGTPGEAEKSRSYAYGNADWKDLLTEYDGQAITYDGIGNPLTYRDGMTFTWMRGRRLATLTKDGVNSSYTYDDNGIRTSKTVGGTKTDYYLNGSTILTQISGGTRLDFFYDAAGSAAGFKYNGETYYYTKNLQGDITRIRDSKNIPVATYRYDSWGKVVSVGGNQTIAKLNPFRYRGYYYDEESGLYYLNSRYYDPETGRFVNADSYVSTGQGVLGYNMFAYCNNNPVNMTDSTGDNPVVFGFMLFGVIEVAAVAAYSGSAGRSSSVSSMTVNPGRIVSETIENVKTVSKIATAVAAAKIYENKVEKQAEKLTGIAKGYEVFKCVDAAEAMKAELLKKNQKGAIIKLNFPNAYDGMVCSEKLGYNQAISYNGNHFGVLYKGIVYCNIYPEGLPREQWINSFGDAWGSEPIVKEYPF